MSLESLFSAICKRQSIYDYTAIKLNQHLIYASVCHLPIKMRVLSLNNKYFDDIKFQGYFEIPSVVFNLKTPGKFLRFLRA